MKEETTVALIMGLLTVLFGAYALWLGYDNVVISAVFGALGTIAGYVFAKRGEKEAEKPAEA